MASTTRARGKPDDPKVRGRLDVIRDTKRQLVIDAARRVFETHGLEGASIRLIAIEAGCTTGAIYPYFSGKEEIYAAILGESLAALKLFIEQHVDKRREPVDRARAAVDAFYAYYKERPTELSLGLYLFRGAGVRPTGLKPDLDRTLNAQLRAAVDVISATIASAGFDRATALATDGVSHAIGLLIMDGTGRLKLFQEHADGLMAQYLERLLPGA
ncbi:TetR/AcrR family transcriptional regulator [Reyranella sp. CPCC 100927]|uniref:TetR/AcrR family transcriptional regulator n=1 Tax=Reyranella sp. CPCC 100927 TaxID=2599616 RepID=UPI0011B4F65B|nr:TetR/AcrR family transcriptional regulator [Reyranella sp. CPCC 100927]TWT15378.1 TetR/AcrR family transcriptional regulator [Reyranella sp. CPCC 100927]